MVGDNGPKPDWWDVDPHDWPTMSISAADYDQIMAQLERPPRIKYRLRDALERRFSKPLALRTLSGLGEN